MALEDMAFGVLADLVTHSDDLQVGRCVAGARAAARRPGRRCNVDDFVINLAQRIVDNFAAVNGPIQFGRSDFGGFGAARPQFWTARYASLTDLNPPPIMNEIVNNLVVQPCGQHVPHMTGLVLAGRKPTPHPKPSPVVVGVSATRNAGAVDSAWVVAAERTRP